jgi:hypothetical protein
MGRKSRQVSKLARKVATAARFLSFLTVVSLFAIVINALTAAPLYGQTRGAIISGQVKDPSGALVPNATIIIRNTDTGVAQTTASNGEGIFSVPALIPGNYTVTVESTGMKRLEHGGIVLQVGDHIGLDLVMQIGSQTQVVTVTGQLPALRTEDAESGEVIDAKRITELPAYDRNPLAFALLAPNVNGTTEQMGYSNDFRINGGRAAEADYFVDGVSVTTGYEHNVAPGIPGMEALDEFKVVTNGMSAEYGRLSGGAVSVVTRSGTNDLHGSLYEFFQNDVLNANDWNSNRYSKPKGAFHNNIYGFAVGGPVWLPKVYNGRNKTFFFLNYEATKYVAGTFAATTGVPTGLERTGDFSQTLNYAGTAFVQVSDPLTGVMTPSGVVRTPFPQDKIPQNRWNPLASIIMGIYPAANHASLPGSNHNANWIGSYTSRNTLADWTGRLDENWTPKSSTHFSWIESNSASGSTALFPGSDYTTGTSGGETISLEHVHMFNPSTVATLRIGAVRDVITSGSIEAGVEDSTWPLGPYMRDFLGTTTGRLPSTGMDYDWIGQIGGGSVSNEYDTNFTFSAALQKVWGKQTLKFGFEHRRYYSNVPTGGYLNDSVGPETNSVSYVNSGATGSGLAGLLLGYIDWGDGAAYAGPASLQTYDAAYIQDDMRLTSKLKVNAGIRWDYEPPRTERFNRQIWWDKNYHWPVNPNPGWTWASVEAAAGVANAPVPAWVTDGYELGRCAILGSTDYPGRTAEQNLPHHFAPRLGFAWEFAPKTVLRGGYAISWLTTTGSYFMGSAPWNLGFGDYGRFYQGGTPDNGLTWPFTINNPMAGGYGFVPNAFVSRNENATNQSLADAGWFIANAHDVYPGYEHDVELSLQHEFGSGSNSWVLEGSFNGNFGRMLPYWLGKGEHILPNAYHILGPYGFKTLYTGVPNPIYGQTSPSSSQAITPTMAFGRVEDLEPFWEEAWTMGEPLGTSNYWAGYFQLEHHFGRGFSFLVNYTLSKMLQDVGSIDNQFAQGPNQQGFPQAGLGFSDIYGLAPTDITNKVLFNYAWDIPVGRGRGHLLTAPSGAGGRVLNGVLGGWRVAGTTTFRGEPIMVYSPGGGVGEYGSNWYNLGQSRTCRPVYTGVKPLGFTSNGHAALQGSANMKLYENQAAFREPINMEIGDLPSTSPNWRGPGFSQWDFAVMKNFPLFSEHRTLQFRFESQNLFNHMNCAMPASDVGDSLFGQITGTGPSVTTYGLSNPYGGGPRTIMVAVKILF